MANLNAPRGFRALQNEAGTAPKIKPFTIQSGKTIYEGSPVAINTTGHAVLYSDATTILCKQGVGVAAHYRAHSSTGNNTVLVYTDPQQEYEIQSDDNTLTTLSDVLFRNFAATNQDAGSSTTLQSTTEIEGSTGTSVSTPATAATRRPFKGLGFSKNLQNDNSATRNRIVVKFNPAYHMGASDSGV